MSAGEPKYPHITDERKVSLCLEKLVEGFPITVQGRTFRLFAPHTDIPLFDEIGNSDDWFFGTRMERTSVANPKKLEGYLGVDLPFADVLGMFTKMADGEVFNLITTAVLSKPRNPITSRGDEIMLHSDGRREFHI